MKHVLVLGIEHLMTGIQLFGDVDAFQFERESPSMVKVTANGPFKAYWPNRSILDSVPVEEPFETHFPKDGEVEWYAKRMAEAMRKCDEESYKMQNYARRPMEYPGEELSPTEPYPFPKAVVDAMRNKHGADADTFLSRLRWNGDHWFYNHDRMYIGVEPDGYIHT